MLGIVTDMPVWVIILLVSSLLYCISFCFKKDVSIKLLIIIPGGFMIFSIISLLQQGNIIIAGLMWLAGCIIGGMAANRIFSPQTYHRGRKAGTITVPGTWSVIIIFFGLLPSSLLYRLSSGNGGRPCSQHAADPIISSIFRRCCWFLYPSCMHYILAL
ncbi:hypothetical protein [Dickeya oryzae]